MLNLKTKTVDGIMSAFTKTIADLKAVEQSSTADAITMREHAARLQRDADFSQNEANRARNIAANLEGLLNAG